jgi:uncharacterized protein (DUF58 family)
MEYRDKILVAVRATLVLSDLAQRRGDYVGLTCFRNKITLFLPPARSGEQAYRILKTLCQFYRTGETSNLKTTGVEIVRTLQRRSIINLITDINHNIDDYVYFSRLMWARGHVTNILLVADESEIHMPDVGWLTLTESEDRSKITIDTSELKKEYDDETSYLLKNIFSSCTTFGTKVLLLKTLKEVDSKILELASLYRVAREGVYR